ncbi:hypothetical protein [Anaeromyxobacter diazotrophicus]|uniref:Uncharacterized protein n=1 Tax=Anaeromyxobacter diazotrophicus TaxID=2590199 RepID=A0A7I9VGJ9_9BACT|nr:hypothetical protein [Anaeromyxobacter diazotrophicus]GEJ55524.1 hypothetical protein AMYX_02650 [Anaeromyxobacter diazotrophicus]
MSDLPPSQLTYEVVVAEYFLGLRGAGLMLSPLDLEQVRAWERRGLPVAVVCRGLKHGLEAALRDRPEGSPPPRALRAYRRAVEDAWRAYQGGRVGDAPPPPGEAEVAAARLAAARALLAAAPAGGPAAGGLAAARAALAACAGAGLAEVEGALDAADAALLRGWIGALPRADRAALGPRCRRLAGDRPPWTRPAAYRHALRAHLADAGREAGLLRLAASV